MNERMRPVLTYGRGMHLFARKSIEKELGVKNPEDVYRAWKDGKINENTAWRYYIGIIDSILAGDTHMENIGIRRELRKAIEFVEEIDPGSYKDIFGDLGDLPFSIEAQAPERMEYAKESQSKQETQPLEKTHPSQCNDKILKIKQELNAEGKLLDDLITVPSSAGLEKIVEKYWEYLENVVPEMFTEFICQKKGKPYSMSSIREAIKRTKPIKKYKNKPKK
ncbi:MAG: hypothetical protein LBP76_08220 [Treponema sp.]|jgi:hypothetical protein|nr:hypothetical protein [Treponema sp.]